VYLLVEREREKRRRRASDSSRRRRGKKTAAGKEEANHDGADEILFRRLVSGEFSRLLPFSSPP
jgi:hypothetical protein